MGGLTYFLEFLERELIERGLIQEMELISNSRPKFFSNGILQSLCIASIEKLVLATMKVYIS